jgi:hypothetical protein
VADRVPVDIQGLRDEIENAYPPETFWRELSLSQKIRHLVVLGLKHKDDSDSSDKQTSRK